MLKKVIYTVGHSTHPIAYFAELLETYHINCVVDVRSVAASRFNPQFNKEPLMNYLQNHYVRNTLKNYRNQRFLNQMSHPNYN